MKTEQKDERYGYVLGVIGLVAIATVILGLFAAHARFNYKIEAMESRIERQGQEIEILRKVVYLNERKQEK